MRKNKLINHTIIHTANDSQISMSTSILMFQSHEFISHRYIPMAIENIERATMSFARDSDSSLKANLCGTLKLDKAVLTHTGSVGEIVEARITKIKVEIPGRIKFQSTTIENTLNITLTSARTIILI